ncbi:MAG: hypothetical protein HYU41_22765 [Candidatus Rokubacteria bacterium]|nr:hypothetical protein [Candidatus Rokubacteria bacterium]
MLVLVALGTGGCLFVAFPKTAGPPNVRVVTEEAAKFIRLGVTTREDVVLTLGSPDIVTDDERRFVYASSYRVGSVVGVMVGLFGLGRMTEHPRHRRTLVEIRFADDATVRDVRVESDTVFMREELLRRVP